MILLTVLPDILMLIIPRRPAFFNRVSMGLSCPGRLAHMVEHPNLRRL